MKNSMPGRNFFLAFFLAFAAGGALIWILDSRPGRVADLRPVSGNLDSAYPLRADRWLLQIAVRSRVSQPYFRSLVYEPQTGRAVALPGFWRQYYVVGYEDDALQLMAEDSYLRTITGSLLASRLEAPPEVEAQLFRLEPSGSLRRETGIVIRETGLPFRCAGRLRTADYGGSDTTFFSLSPDQRREAWVTVPDSVKELPFCGADGYVYLKGEDRSWRAVDRLERFSAILKGRFDLSGAWLGAEKKGSCTYIRPADADAPFLAGSPVTFAESGPCADRLYRVDGIVARTRQWDSEIVMGNRRLAFHGRMAGLSGAWAVLQQDRQILWVDLGDGRSYARPITSLFPSFPPLPD